MTAPDGRQSDEPWRIGTSWGIHVYQGEKGSPGERPVATFHDPADAQRAVDAVNGRADGRARAAEEVREAAGAWDAGRANPDVACECDADLVPPHPAHLPWPTRATDAEDAR